MGLRLASPIESEILKDPVLAQRAMDLLVRNKAIESDNKLPQLPEDLYERTKSLRHDSQVFLAEMQGVAKKAGIGEVQGIELGQFSEKNRCLCNGGMITFDNYLEHQLDMRLNGPKITPALDAQEIVAAAKPQAFSP